MDVGQAEVAAGVVEDETLVVEARALARIASEEGVSTCSISSLARRAGVPEL